MKEVKTLMDRIGARWAICGGDAIDLFVGRDTRLHKDIDIAVFWEDRKLLINNFINNGWRIFEPDNGLLREITSIENDLYTEDNLWCIKSDVNSYDIENIHGDFYKIVTDRKHQDKLDFIELLFNSYEDDLFIYKRNSNIRLAHAIQCTQEDVPYLAPEMVLLYKSIFTRYLESERESDIEMIANYRHDFDVSTPLLNDEQRNWLKNALSISYPNGHEWLSRL